MFGVSIGLFTLASDPGLSYFAAGGPLLLLGDLLHQTTNKVAD